VPGGAKTVSSPSVPASRAVPTTVASSAGSVTTSVPPMETPVRSSSSGVARTSRAIRGAWPASTSRRPANAGSAAATSCQVTDPRPPRVSTSTLVTASVRTRAPGGAKRAASA
jgi:hypothetical protein